MIISFYFFYSIKLSVWAWDNIVTCSVSIQVYDMLLCSIHVSHFKDGFYEKIVEHANHLLISHIMSICLLDRRDIMEVVIIRYDIHKEFMNEAYVRRLREQVRRAAINTPYTDKNFTFEEWLALIERQDHRCADCKKICSLSVDHIVPISKMGANTIDNIQGLCRSCNSRKHDYISLDQYRKLHPVFPGVKLRKH